jgi:glycosyltransferase involved in cell wall biosynthesis
MKIALITEYLEPQINGIAVRYSEIIKNLKKEGHTVYVYGPENCNDVDFILPSIKNYWNIHNRIAFPTLQIIKNIAKENYDAIYMVLPPLFWYPIISIIAKKYGIKIITSNHVYLDSYNKTYIKNKIIRNILHYSVSFHTYYLQNLLSDIIIAPSKFKDIKDFVETSKFQISPNGINHDKFPFKKKIKKSKNIVFVGRIAPEKNLEKLFELFNVLDNYTLTVIGDGPDLTKYKEKYKTIIKLNF